MINSVKVGPLTYQIREVDHIEDQKYAGMIYYTENLIEINKTTAEQHKPITVIHEIIHAIMHQAGYQEHDESVIEALSYGLLQTLRENPELLKYLTNNDV